MASAGRRGARLSVRLQDIMDDDMTEREDDEQTDHSSTGVAVESPRADGGTPVTTAGTPPSQVHSPPLFGGAHHSPPEAFPPGFAEDDDYRSETSSSETNSREYTSGATHTPKPVSASYTNHRDLSARLKQAIRSHDSEGDSLCFDDTMIGADVVLCARTRADNHLEDDNEMETSATPRAVETKRFYAHRFMLAASSEPFRAMLTGRMRESAQREVEILGVDASILEKMLRFIYTGEVTVDLQNVVGLLIGAEMYALAGLREICKGFVLIHAQDIFRDPQVVQIPEKVLIEIVENDDLQIKEIALMEALVMWGESRVASSEKPILEILSDVMEHVRFPTMSVSDLYGKVRPFVQDGVIREALLTEALFYHLKWGTHASRASHRMRPRAGATALRKRKRVSFIQHVSFVNEQ